MRCLFPKGVSRPLSLKHPAFSLPIWPPVNSHSTTLFLYILNLTAGVGVTLDTCVTSTRFHHCIILSGNSVLLLLLLSSPPPVFISSMMMWTFYLSLLSLFPASKPLSALSCSPPVKCHYDYLCLSHLCL